MTRYRQTFTYRLFSAWLSMVLIVTFTVPAHAQSLTIGQAGVPSLPAPGTMVSLSAAYNPAIIKGITLFPDNPLKFDFIIDPGDDNLQGANLKKEANKLINYFMASLTVPEAEMWVNLSPYEKDRIIASGLSQTELGRDLLAQDYVLKQLTASLMYPEEGLGNDFWTMVYAKAQERYGTTNIPMNTFNKVWIIPDKANVYVNGNNVFVVNNYFRVMLEEDYLALETNIGHDEHGVGQIPEDQVREISEVSKEVIREVLLPEIEREVNEGRNFANLRQIFNSMILATWYKQNFKDSLLGQVYLNQNKVNGIDIEDKDIKEKIYQQYVEAFKVGVFNFIKEDYDEATQEVIPRKYFSGGIEGNLGKVIEAGGPRSRSKLFGGLFGAMVFSVLLNMASLAQEPPVPPDTTGGKPAVVQTLQETYDIRVKQHPYFKSYSHDPDGSDRHNKPAVTTYISGPDLLPGFDPNSLVSNPNKSVAEIITSMQPLNRDHQRFSDLSAIAGADAEPLAINARNVNADLGLQGQIRRMKETGVIGKQTFVILSHGHFIAGMAELAKPNSDGEYLFDPSLYFPRINWNVNSLEAKNTIRQQFQLWSETIKRAREGNTERQGVPAVVLFGHRDWEDLSSKTLGPANINPESLLGPSHEFAEYLKSQGFTKVVIITERFVEKPNEFQDLGLESLITGSFSDANKDLYAYLKTLTDSLSVSVKVVSGDIRPPVDVTGANTKGKDLPRDFVALDKPVSVEEPGIKGLDSTLVTKHKDGVRYVFNIDEKKFAAYRNWIPLDIKSEDISSEIQRFGEEILKSDSVSEEIKRKVSEALGTKKTGYLIPSGLDTSESVLLAGKVRILVQKDMGVNFTTIDVQKGLGLPSSSEGLLIAMLQVIPGVTRRKNGGWTKKPGGIDLNPNNMDLQVQGNESKFNFPADSQLLNGAPVHGFVPVIINISPITNIPLMLGELENVRAEGQLSLAPIVGRP